MAIRLRLIYHHPPPGIAIVLPVGDGRNEHKRISPIGNTVQRSGLLKRRCNFKTCWKDQIKLSKIQEEGSENLKRDE